MSYFSNTPLSGLDLFWLLPEEVTMLVFSFLDHPSLINVELVCRYFRRSLGDYFVYFCHMRNLSKDNIVSLTQGKESWREKRRTTARRLTEDFLVKSEGKQLWMKVAMTDVLCRYCWVLYKEINNTHLSCCKNRFHHSFLDSGLIWNCCGEKADSLGCQVKVGYHEPNIAALNSKEIQKEMKRDKLEAREQEMHSTNAFNLVAAKMASIAHILPQHQSEDDEWNDDEFMPETHEKKIWGKISVTSQYQDVNEQEGTYQNTNNFHETGEDFHERGGHVGGIELGGLTEDEMITLAIQQSLNEQ